MSQIENDYRKQLNAARTKMPGGMKQGAESLAKDYAKGMMIGGPIAAQLKVGWELFKQTDWFLDWLIGLPLFFALLKDIVDWFGLAVIPGVNDVIVWCISGFTAIVIFALGASKPKLTVQIAKKIVVILVGTIAEEIPGVDELPILTIMVLVSYILVLIERKGYAEARKKQQVMEETTA